MKGLIYYSISVLLLSVCQDSFAQKSSPSKKASQTTPEKKIGCISGDCQNGFGTYVYPDSSFITRNGLKFKRVKYVGNFVSGIRNGQGVCYYNGAKDNETYKIDGTWKNDEIRSGIEYDIKNKILEIYEEGWKMLTSQNCKFISYKKIKDALLSESEYNINAYLKELGGDLTEDTSFYFPIDCKYFSNCKSVDKTYYYCSGSKRVFKVCFKNRPAVYLKYSIWIYTDSYSDCIDFVNEIDTYNEKQDDGQGGCNIFITNYDYHADPSKYNYNEIYSRGLDLDFDARDLTASGSGWRYRMYLEYYSKTTKRN